MSRIDLILSNVVALRDSIEDRISQKVDAILDQSALNSSSIAILKRPKAGEVTLFGDFDWSPKLSAQQEIDFFLDKNGVKWTPSTLDFMEASNLSPNFTVGGFEALIASIADYDENSIARLNFWTHSDSSRLGIAGYIEPGILGSQKDHVQVIFKQHVDETRIEYYAQKGLEIVQGSKRKERRITMDDVRKRFKKDAIFVLYACNAGVNERILKSLSNLFKVTVIGFKHEIVYCPPPQDKPPFKRKGTKIGINKNTGGCGKNKVTSDWRLLITDDSAVKIPYIVEDNK